MRDASTGSGPHSRVRVCRPLGGEVTGKDPTNRGKLGTKRHIVVDRGGLPFAATVSGLNVYDSGLLDETLYAVPPLRLPGQRRGRPRQRPVKQHADKGYNDPRCRRALRSRGAASHRAGSPDAIAGWWSARSWLSRCRRLKVRSERRADIHHALLSLGCALICFRALQAAYACRCVLLGAVSGPRAGEGEPVSLTLSAWSRGDRSARS
ncbi:MAG TPA: transposase [Ktedonobacterales bacterium]|nr:transposase [Ktedonobacterales bacterium]